MTLHDCELKGLVLRAVRDGYFTSKDIYNHIPYDNWKCLLVEITQLKNRGYLSKTAHKGRLNQYTLTRFGLKHAIDPMCNKRWKHNRIAEIIKEKVDENVNEILSNTKKFQEAVNRAVQQLEKERIPIIVEKVFKKPAPTMKIKKQIITEPQRAYKRKRLVNDYLGKYLNLNFFKRWGNVKPVKLKGIRLGMPGSVEILSLKHNKEVNRNHVHFVFDTEYIRVGRFEIVDANENGIFIFGDGMKSPQFLRW